MGELSGDEISRFIRNARKEISGAVQCNVNLPFCTHK